MVTNNTLQKIKIIYEELKTYNTAVLSGEDIVALEELIMEGYGTKKIEFIVTDKTIKDEIQNNKVFAVEFDDESKTKIKECIECGGKSQGTVSSIKEGSPNSDFLACTFKKDEVVGVILLDNHSVAVLRQNISTPLILNVGDANAARFLFDNLSKDLS